ERRRLTRFERKPPELLALRAVHRRAAARASALVVHGEHGVAEKRRSLVAVLVTAPAGDLEASDTLAGGHVPRLDPRAIAHGDERAIVGDRDLVALARR